MEKKYYTKSSDETIKIGEKLGNLLEKKDVILLVGDLSAGKTTITKGIGKSLGVSRIINSPTFTIVKEYSGTKCKLYHLDLYRLDGLNQDFDLEEYFESDGVCVIEWPYQVKEIIPDEYLSINIKLINENEREITISGNSEHYDDIVKRLDV